MSIKIEISFEDLLELKTTIDKLEEENKYLIKKDLFNELKIANTKVKFFSNGHWSLRSAVFISENIVNVAGRIEINGVAIKNMGGEPIGFVEFKFNELKVIDQWRIVDMLYNASK